MGTADVLMNIIQRIHHQDNSHNSMSSLFSLSESASIDPEFNLFYSFQDRIRSPESLLSYWLNLGIDEGPEVLNDLGLSNQQEWNLREVSELLLDELQHCRTLQKHPSLN